MLFTPARVHYFHSKCSIQFGFASLHITNCHLSPHIMKYLYHRTDKQF